MTNLYDFLRNILEQCQGVVPHGQVTITPEEEDWIDRYLSSSDHELHFKGTSTGKATEKGEEIFEQHYGIKGSPNDVFALLTEAMMQNPTLAQVVLSAGRFYLTKAPICRSCHQRHNGHAPDDCPNVVDFNTWQFYPRKR